MVKNKVLSTGDWIGSLVCRRYRFFHFMFPGNIGEMKKDEKYDYVPGEHNRFGSCAMIVEGSRLKAAGMVFEN